MREAGFGGAAAEAAKVMRGPDVARSHRADGRRLTERIAAAVDASATRAAGDRATGRPHVALRLLQRHAGEMKDRAFRRAAKAEGAFALACAGAARMAAKQEPAERLREVFRSLPDD